MRLTISIFVPQVSFRRKHRWQKTWQTSPTYSQRFLKRYSGSFLTIWALGILDSRLHVYANTAALMTIQDWACVLLSQLACSTNSTTRHHHTERRDRKFRIPSTCSFTTTQFCHVKSSSGFFHFSAPRFLAFSSNSVLVSNKPLKCKHPSPPRTWGCIYVPVKVARHRSPNVSLLPIIQRANV